MTRRRLAGLGVLFFGTILAGCSGIPALVAMGEERELREDPEPGAPPPDGPRAGILLVAFDGVRREVLYDLLRDGELPGLEALLGGREGRTLPHAWLADDLVTTLPSATIPAWATIFTGVVPAEHGVVGNEQFDRRTGTFVAPVPASFSDVEPVLRTYTDSHADRLLAVPTVYHRLHALERDLTIWVSMSPFHGGADKLLAAQRSAVIDVVPAIVAALADDDSPLLYEERDQELLDTAIDEIDEQGFVPDVLTLYVSGTDQYAHATPGDPDESIRRFLRGRIDESFLRLAETLREHGALENRYVVVVADHGHTDVESGDARQLHEEPTRVLRDAGFRPRPFRLDVDDEHPFSAVLAYQGALAYVSLADRSRCPGARDVCDWKRPPRFEEDVLAAAEAFDRANHSGPLRGALEAIFVRRPVAPGDSPRPFSLYLGGGRTAPLSGESRDAWLELSARLCDLAVGPYGDRVGEILLLAKNATGDSPAERFYFNSSPYESGHGSPSPRDSEIPLIVAHPNRSPEDLEALARRFVGERTEIEDVADLLVALRHGGEPPAEALRTKPRTACGG